MKIMQPSETEKKLIKDGNYNIIGTNISGVDNYVGPIVGCSIVLDYYNISRYVDPLLKDVSLNADEVKELVKIINSRNPDIVIFTGDLIDKNYDISDKDKEKFIHEISKLKASIGKYSVFGDEDSDDYSSIIKQAGFNLLDNSYDLVYDGDKTPIIIIGISSLLSNNYDIDSAFSYFKESNSNSNLYSIVVFHEPDLTDYVLKNKNADLLLAGHSHNGYVKLPFVNGLIKSDGAMEYYDERYEFSNSKLFISSGIGTNGSGVRFMCQPSVNFFRLSSK